MTEMRMGMEAMQGARGRMGGIPLLLTHAILAPPPCGVPVPALRRGARVVLTHAHPAGVHFPCTLRV